jgi:hypothetical protein
VGDSHTAPDGDVETDEVSGLVVRDGDETKIVGEDVDVVAAKVSRKASDFCGLRRRKTTEGNTHWGGTAMDILNFRGR